MSNAIQAMKAKLVSGSEWNGRFWLAWYGHTKAMTFMIAMALTACLILAIPTEAHADPFGITDSIGNAIANTPVGQLFTAINEAPKNLLEDSGGHLQNIKLGQLTNSFSNLISGSTDSQGRTALDIAKAVNDTMVTTAAYAVLVIVYLVQLVRLANKFESNGVMPQVKEVIFLLLGFVIMKYIIDNSFDFATDIYDWSAALVEKLPGIDSNPYQNVVSTDGVDMSQWTLQGNQQEWISHLLVAGIVWLSTLGAEAVAYVVLYARSMQLYIYSMVAPIPLCFLGVEETRQWGMGFLKSFLALCIAGLIIGLVLILWPYFQASATMSDDYGLNLLASSLLLIYALFKSGSWARDVLGG